MRAMKVGILGSGPVGQSLGRGFAARGHDVKIGTRTPGSEKLKKWRQQAGGASSTGTFAQAAAHGEILVHAILGTAAEDVVRLAGPDNFTGKILIDVTNPLDFSRGMPPGLFVGTTDSLGERIQRELPKAKVVKCFNIVNNETMIDPANTGTKPTMMFCGDDEGAKRTVSELLRDFGWDDMLDLGGIDGARWLEALVPLWVRATTKRGTWTLAFKVVHP